MLRLIDVDSIHATDDLVKLVNEYYDSNQIILYTNSSQNRIITFAKNMFKLGCLPNIASKLNTTSLHRNNCKILHGDIDYTQVVSMYNKSNAIIFSTKHTDCKYQIVRDCTKLLHILGK